MAAAATTASAVEEGVVWRKESSGRVSTTSTGKRVWIRSIKAASGVSSGGVPAASESLCDRISQESNWRQNYTKHLGAAAGISLSTPESTVSQLSV